VSDFSEGPSCPSKRGEKKKRPLALLKIRGERKGLFEKEKAAN